jgi:hypothetical protein
MHYELPKIIVMQVFPTLLWFYYTYNFDLCALETKHIEGSIFSQISNLCTCKKLCKISQCFVDHIVIAIDNKGYGRCLNAFYKRCKVTAPPPPLGQVEALVVGHGVQEHELIELDGGCLVSCRDVCNVGQNNYTFACRAPCKHI